jgi:lipopolysaccharide export LptBFGC system permease protein LptF
MMAPWLLALAVLPRVEDPWPDTISFWLPVSTAGLGMTLAAVLFVRSPRERREDATRLGIFWGFVVGLLFYVIALAAQVISSL